MKKTEEKEEKFLFTNKEQRLRFIRPNIFDFTQALVMTPPQFEKFYFFFAISTCDCETICNDVTWEYELYNTSNLPSIGCGFSDSESRTNLFTNRNLSPMSE
jgi:hypothetical protein